MTTMASIRETAVVRVYDAVRVPVRPRRRVLRAARPEERALAPMLLAAALSVADGDRTRLWFSQDGSVARVLNRPRSEGLPSWLEAEQASPTS